MYSCRGTLFESMVIGDGNTVDKMDDNYGNVEVTVQ